MRVKISLGCAVLLATSYMGCDCGSTPAAKKDAGHLLYDGGPADAAVLDTVGADLVGVDTLGQDTWTAEDASGDDAGANDASANDASANDASAEDVRGDDAAGDDAAVGDAALADVGAADTMTADAVGSDVQSLDTMATDTVFADLQREDAGATPDTAVASDAVPTDAFGTDTIIVVVDAAVADTAVMDTAVADVLPPDAYQPDGANRLPTLGTITASPADLVGTTTLGATPTDADGHSMTCLFAETTAHGVGIAPDTEVWPCQAVVSEPAGGLPSGTPVTIRVTVTDSEGGTDSDTLSLTVGNHSPEITSLVSSAGTPFVGTSTLTATVEDIDPETPSCTFDDVNSVGVAIVQAGSGDCIADITEPSLPRGTEVVILVTADDGLGGTDAQSITLTVGNHDPGAEAGDNLSLLPGESGLLTSSGSDPDLTGVPADSITCSWSSDTVGVAVSDPASCTPQVQVDRLSYESGPTEQVATLTLTVVDDAGGTAQDTVEVTVLDERGPYVDVTSTYQGVDYSAAPRHGFCGHPNHPCSNIDDAVDNLRALIDDGVTTYADATVKVATVFTSGNTPEPHLRDSRLDLDNSDGIIIHLECGYNREGWVKPPAYTRTPILFSNDLGVSISGNGVVLSSCQILGVDGDTSVLFAERIAVEVSALRATIDDNQLSGNSQSTTKATSAIGLSLSTSDAAVTNNVIEGGFAETSAVGISSDGGTPTIDSNRIEGGVAQTVKGIDLVSPGSGVGSNPVTVTSNDIVGGDGAASGGLAVGVDVTGRPRIAENTVLGGGTAETNIGIRVNAGTNAAVEIQDNPRIVGSDGAIDAVVAGIALHALGDVELLNNNLQGGTANSALGLLCESSEVIANGDSIQGGQAVTETTGVVLSDCTATMTSVEVTGSLHNAEPYPTQARGIDVGSSSELDCVTCTILSGAGDQYATGIITAGNAVSVHLTGSRTQGGPANDLDGQSTGILKWGGRLEVEGGTVTSGDAASSTGVRSGGDSGGIAFDEGQTHIHGGFTIQAGTANSGNSTGIDHQAGNLVVDQGEVMAGDSSQYSYGIDIYCRDGLDIETGTHSITQAFVSSGVGAVTYGLDVGPDATADGCGQLTLEESQFRSQGTAATYTTSHYTYGVKIVQTDTWVTTVDATSGDSAGDCHGFYLRDAQLISTDLTATSGNSSGGLSSDRSVGLFLNNADASVVTGGTITSGSATGSGDDDSRGVRIWGATERLMILGVDISAGDADDNSEGIAVGQSCTDCVFDHNTVEAGVAARSAGVWFDTAISGLQFLENTVIGGVATGSGVNDVAVGLWFDSSCTDCMVHANEINAGTGRGGVRSIGLRMNPGLAAGIATTYVVNNYIHGGVGSQSHGIEVSGLSGPILRFLHNTIDAGGADTTTISAAVVMGWEQQATGEVGVFASNHLTPGSGATMFHFLEWCDQSSGSEVYGQPYRADTNNYLPSLTLPYIYIGERINCASANLVMNIGGVHATPLYDASNGPSLAVDPGFSGLYDLTGTSPLRGQALSTFGRPWWDPSMGTMLDIDGEERPLTSGTVDEPPDIGCDEVH